MDVPRQEDSLETGRVNQKRRTRAAVVAAATDLLQQGITPTVAQAAEAALVSRTTAYRYFPTQESLLVELSVNLDVDDVEALVAQPVDRAGARARVLELIDQFNRHVHADEAQYRTAMRLYQDQWLEAVAKGEDAPLLREGRRGRWLATSLAPIADEVAPAELARLIVALSLVTGPEPMVVLRDVCHIDEAAALEITDWIARVLLDATFGASTTPEDQDAAG